jgi:hypothetical protein
VWLSLVIVTSSVSILSTFISLIPTYAIMRLPYTDNPPKFTAPEDQEILKQVQARRGEKGLIPLDLALLHAPKIAGGKTSATLEPS